MKSFALGLAALLSAVAPTFADPTQDGPGSQTLSLRDVLKQDFGLDLPIVADGPGAGERNNPIIILSSDAHEIGNIAFQTIGGIQKGTSFAYQANEPSDQVVGVLWRSLDRGLRFSDETGLYVYRLNRKLLNAKQVIDEKTAYYFEIQGSETDVPDIFPGPSGPFISSLGLSLPAEIGWLKYDAKQSVDYAAEYGRPELGVGAAYSALGVKATVYVYPSPEQPVTTSVVQFQFEQAARDVEERTTDATAWPDRRIDDSHFVRVWQVGDGTQVTALAMASYQDQLLKLRTTWFRDPILDDATSEFINTVFAMVPEQAEHGDQ